MSENAGVPSEAADKTALSRLLAMSTSEFASGYWGVRAMLARAESLDGVGAELFSAAAVDELVARRGIRTPFIRMAKEGQVLPAIRFTGSGGFGAEMGDQVDSAKVFAEFAAGSTIVLQGLHRTWSPLAEFTRQLVADLGHPVQVNAYVTPAQSRGFDPHYDVHDVFVVQISGEKQWRIHEPALLDPMPNEPWTSVRADVERQASEAPVIDETLRPGDVLYLPRGWIHSATALGETSVHLTIGVAALTRRDLVDLLLENLDTTDLRGSLPIGGEGADVDLLASTVADTIAALTTALEHPDVAASVAARVSARVRRSTRPEPLEPLAAVDAIARLSASTPVRWRRGQSTRITTGGDTVSLHLDQTTITFPREAAAALSELAEGEVVVTGRLSGIDTDSAIVVVRRLIREGVLIAITPPVTIP